MTGLEHVDIDSSLRNMNAPLCVLTDVQTTFECGICLQMVSGSHVIEKKQLVTHDRSERYLHVLYTMQRDIFEPCSFSGICSGVNYEFDDSTCVNLVNKLTKYHFSSVQVDHLDRPKPKPAKMRVAIKAIDHTTQRTSLCYKTSATFDRQTECLGCMALYSKGMAVLLVSQTTAAHESDQNDKKTEQLVFLTSNRSQRFIEKCKELCGSTTSKSKSKCLEAYKSSISYSTTVGKIYYNMAARNLRTRTKSWRKLSDLLSIQSWILCKETIPY
ncbi:hypothetical protein ABG067_003694 [Albugo candida]